MSETHSFDPHPQPELMIDPILTTHAAEEGTDQDVDQDWEASLDAILNELESEEIIADSGEITETSRKSSPETAGSETESRPSSLPEKTPETDWFQLACKLKEQNRELIQSVVSLEQALAQAKHDIQEQQRKFREQELLLPEKNDESLQVNQLKYELDLAQQENQRQKLEIDTLMSELSQTSERMAQLERECALLKEDHQEKVHQLTTAERHILELHTRLQRQQRYTLEYKAALDQQLGETKEPSGEGIVSLSPPKMSIQPWSGQTIPLDLEKDNETLSPEDIPPVSAPPPRHPSFRVNLSKVATQYGTDEPLKPHPQTESIDLPAFLRRKSS